MGNKLTVGSCFSGIGGLELGLEWTGGFETKWQIENDEYASRVLEKHWPNVKRYSDIRDVIRPEPVDLICGGFPCQDVSLAGKRAGLEGKRSTLWGEMFRLICEVKPRWVLAENVPGLLSSDDGRFFGNILRDLATAGYDAEWGVLSAAGVGAPHLRRRVFILAHAIGNVHFRAERGGYAKTKGMEKKDRPQFSSSREFGGASESRLSDQGYETNPDAECVGREKGARRERVQSEKQMPSGSDSIDIREVLADTANTGIKSLREWENHIPEGWWNSEPNVGRVAHGVPSRVDRLRCLGNAVVPQVAQKIGEMILNHARNAQK